MNERIELSDEFRDDPFHVADAKAMGYTPARLAGRDLVAPFRAVRTLPTIEDHAELCHAYMPRSRPWQAFAGTSAAVLWGLPLPPRLAVPTDVVVAVPDNRHAPRAAGVRGLRLRADLWSTAELEGLPVLTPLATWLSLARILNSVELLVVADALVSSSPNYPGLRPDRPYVLPHELAAFVDVVGRATGGAAVRRAAERVRCGVESPMETQLRAAVLDAGFAEPEVNGVIEVDGRFVARGDLVYRDERIVLEYEGAVHRQSAERHDRDIDRLEELRQVGWRVVRVSVVDFRSGRPKYLRLLRRLLLERRTS